MPNHAMIMMNAKPGHGSIIHDRNKDSKRNDCFNLFSSFQQKEGNSLDSVKVKILNKHTKLCVLE